MPANLNKLGVRMSIDRVESLVYGVEDMEACVRFLGDWGLEQVESGLHGATFRTPENQHVVLLGIDDPALPPNFEEGPTVRETVWGVSDEAHLKAIVDELSSDRDVVEDESGTYHSMDDAGLGIGFRLKDEFDVAGSEPVQNFKEHVPRLNARIDRIDRPRPMRIGHVVFNIPSTIRGKAVSFYADRLGFRITDAVTGMGDFMRPDGSTYHHVLFLAHRDRDGAPARIAFNHVAYEVRDFEEIVIGGKWMRDRGWDTSRSPGRHNLGSNLHWYFACPLGGEIEYFSDMDRMDDDWETRRWDEPPVVNFWKAEIVL